MDSCRLLAVCPYEGMKENIKRIGRDYPAFEVTAVGDGDPGLEALLRSDGYDILMSRAGTARRLRELTDRPCVSIDIGLMDLMLTAKMLDSFPDVKPAVISTTDLRECVGLMNDSFIYGVECWALNRSEDAGQAVDEAVRGGRNMIIGTASVWREAKKRGVPALLITSCERSIRSAFDHAEELRRCDERRRRQIAVRDLIADGRKEYWHITDKNGRVVYSDFDRARPGVLEEARSKSDAMHSPVREGGFWHGQYYWEFRRSEELIAGAGPFDALRVRENIELNEDIKAAFTVDDDTYVGDAVSVILNVGGNEPLREQIRDCAGLDLSVMLIGEEGTGRDSYAKEIHKSSPWRDSAFVQINCSALTRSSVKKMFDPENGVFSRVTRATLYFARIHTLTAGFQADILRFLTYRGNRGRFRLISSCTGSGAPGGRSGPAAKRLFALLSEVSIDIPSLARQRENIPVIVGMSLQDLNRRYGWRLRGIDDEGREILLGCDWPGNLNQLKDVMKYVSANMDREAQTTLIPGRWIREAIERTDAVYRKSPPDAVSTEGTLEQIERQVIMKVLAECGMNQTKAAKRLGIGRSTMRRKLARAREEG